MRSSLRCECCHRSELALPHPTPGVTAVPGEVRLQPSHKRTSWVCLTRLPPQLAPHKASPTCWDSHTGDQEVKSDLSQTNHKGICEVNKPKNVQSNTQGYAGSNETANQARPRVSAVLTADRAVSCHLQRPPQVDREGARG